MFLFLDLGDGLLLGLVLLGLVLHVLLLGGLGDLVLLGHLLVLGRGVGLLLLRLGEAGGEVGLADLEDSVSYVFCCVMLIVCYVCCAFCVFMFKANNQLTV